MQESDTTPRAGETPSEHTTGQAGQGAQGGYGDGTPYAGPTDQFPAQGHTYGQPAPAAQHPYGQPPSYANPYAPQQAGPDATPTWQGDGAGPGYQYDPYGQGPLPPVQQRRRGRGWLLGVALAALLLPFLLGLLVGRVSAQPRGTTGLNLPGTSQTVQVAPAANDLQSNVVQVIQNVQPSVVEVFATSGRGEAIGSGEIVSSDGYIVTNDHVVTGSSNFEVVLSNGQHKTAQLKGAAPSFDLAVLKIDATNLKPIAFADSSKVQVGQFAIAVGSPLGLQQSATFGIVSALDRQASESEAPGATLTGLIQTSAPINPGNSGGALVDLSGSLVGVPTLAAASQNGAANGIGFAIPSNQVKTVMNQLIQNGKVTATGQGFLGVSGRTITADVAQQLGVGVDHGAQIAGFANDASGKNPAQQAGLRVGDVITKVDNTEINSTDDLRGALVSKQPGTQVTITYYRGNAQQTAKVTLGERPATQG